jgi:signal transduction histidine kinase
MSARRRPFGSATLRLVALIFGLQMLVTGGVLLYARSAILQQSMQDQQAFVGELRADLRAWHQRGGNKAVAAQINDRLKSLRGENLLLLLTTAKGKQLAGNIDRWPESLPYNFQWRFVEIFRNGSDRAERIGVSASDLPGGAHLLTGRVAESDLRRTQVTQRVLLVSFLLALPLALLVATATTRLINARIAGIARTATAVGNGDLARRVPLDGSGDGFDRLGQGFNAMLTRIEALVSELRIITSGLAHDLRAPIFRLTTTLESAKTETSDPVALAAMDRVSTEAGVLQAMLATALEISQAEAGIGRDRFAEVDVAEFLADIWELYEPATEAVGIELVIEPSTGRFRLHRELVAQAIGNLIDNAMKYAAGANRISLAANVSAGRLHLVVADNGTGIPAEQREQALSRFGRLDPSRHAAGAGLGLSLVEAVARLHDGSLALADNEPGLRVEMTLGN